MSMTRLIRAVMLSVLLLVPQLAAAQSQFVPSQSAPGARQATPQDIIGYLNATVPRTNVEPISQVLQGISNSYLGSRTYPNPGLFRLAPGHLQVFGPTGAWGSQTNILTIIGNPGGGGANAGGFGNVPPGYGNNGNQGNFWDPNYRNAYGGQDAAALLINMAARTPVVVAAPVSSYGTATIQTPIGYRTVYTIRLVTPLTPAQVADMNNTASRPPSMRVDTSGGFFAYTIPPGLVGPTGAPVPPVSADGYTITVDGPWVCVTCNPEVLPAAAAIPPVTQTVSIDTLYVEDVTYGSITTTDLDLVNGVAIDERVMVNDKASVPVLNLLDVNQSTLANGAPFSMKGYMAGVGPGAYNGSGLGNAYMLALPGWEAAFVAQNSQTPYSGNTYGLLTTVGGPTFSVYGVQNSGFLLGADPGNSCDAIASHRANPSASCARTVLLSMAGDLFLARSIHAASVESTGSLTSDGILIASAGAQITGSTSFRNATGQTGYVDPTNGDLLMSGVVGVGRQYMSPAAGQLPLHGCNPAYIGIEVMIMDGRKPGEAAGQGSSVVGKCMAMTLGAAPTWLRLPDYTAVVN